MVCKSYSVVIKKVEISKQFLFICWLASHRQVKKLEMGLEHTGAHLPKERLPLVQTSEVQIPGISIQLLTAPVMPADSVSVCSSSSLLSAQCCQQQDLFTFAYTGPKRTHRNTDWPKHHRNSESPNG